MRQNGAIPRGFEFALYVTAMLWAVAASSIASKAAHGIAFRLAVPSWERLLGSLFLIFLCWFGFQLLDWIATRRGGTASAALPLPRRAGWPAEFGLGAGIGWGLALTAVLPLLLSAHLHARLRLGGANVPAVVLALVTLLAGALATETIARGYGLARLSAAIGPTWAAILTSLGFANWLLASQHPRHLLVALLDGALLGLLLAMAYLRTHALWVGWGLHFAYRAVMAVVLGLPIAGRTDLPALTDSFMSGPRWLTGGGFGLDGALLTGMLTIGAMVVLYRATRDYAWRYTHREIVPGGYEVVVPPPAAHVAMERQAEAAPPPLVQILPSTPAGLSTGQAPPPAPGAPRP